MIYLTDSERLEIIAGCLGFILLCFMIMVCKLSPFCFLHKYCPFRPKYDEEYAMPLNSKVSTQQYSSTMRGSSRVLSHRYIHRRDPYTSSGDSSESETENYISNDSDSPAKAQQTDPDDRNSLGKPFLVKGEMYISMYYTDDIENPSHLNVRIHKVTNLIFRHCDKVKLCIKIQLLKEEKNLEKVLNFLHLVDSAEMAANTEFETQTSLKNINKLLEWNEIKLVPLPKSICENRCIRFVCCLYDRFSQVTQLGETIVACKHVTFQENDVIHKQFAATEQAVKAEVLLSLSFLPTAQKLVVQPVECRQIKLFDVDYPSSVYLRIALLSRGTYTKKRTCLMESQSRLIWNDPVNFDLRNTQLKEVNLLITIKQSIAYNDDIKVKDVGKFVLGLNSGTVKARAQWKEMMLHPRQLQAVWHTVY